MAVTVTGTINGERVDLTWEDGRIGGDPRAIEAVRELAQLHEVIGIPNGPRTVGAREHLADPFSFAFLAQKLFQEGGFVDGLDPYMDEIDPNRDY